MALCSVRGEVRSARGGWMVRVRASPVWDDGSCTRRRERGVLGRCGGGRGEESEGVEECVGVF